MGIARTVVGVALGLLVLGEAIWLWAVPGRRPENAEWLSRYRRLLVIDILLAVLMLGFAPFPDIRVARIGSFVTAVIIAIMQAFRFAQWLAESEDSFVLGKEQAWLDGIKVVILFAYGILLLGA